MPGGRCIAPAHNDSMALASAGCTPAPSGWVATILCSRRALLQSGCYKRGFWIGDTDGNARWVKAVGNAYPAEGAIWAPRRRGFQVLRIWSYQGARKGVCGITRGITRVRVAASGHTRVIQGEEACPCGSIRPCGVRIAGGPVVSFGRLPHESRLPTSRGGRSCHMPLDGSARCPPMFAHVDRNAAAAYSMCAPLAAD